MQNFDLDNPMITRLADACFVTGDLDALLTEYVAAYGMGPWELYGARTAHIAETNTEYTYKYAVCRFSNINFKVIQPLSGVSCYSQYLERYGCGLHHITVETANSFSDALAQSAAAGAAVLQTSVCSEGLVRAITDHVEALGTCLEFVKRPAGYTEPAPDGFFPSGEQMSKYGFTVDTPMITRIMQLAFAVRDRWVTIREYYDWYGIGPWSFHVQDKNSSADVINFGRPIEINNVANVCNSTNVQLEYMQPVDPIDNVYDMLCERGAGLHHICMETANSYEQAMDIMTREGHPAARTCVMDGVEKCAHMDHRSTFGCYFELVFRDKDFVPPIHEIYPPWAKPAKPTSLKKVF